MMATRMSNRENRKMKIPEMKTIIVIAKNWQCRSNGKIYHTVTVYVNGYFLGRSEIITSGFDSDYFNTALEIYQGYDEQAKETRWLPNYCLNQDIVLYSHKINVPNHKDL